jgi:hypothetical protein
MLFGLISRRNRFRAGTRYFSRGIDLEGNVSNFNETEQLILLDSQAGGVKSGPIRGDVRFSYVQTRGSVPVYWAEINNLRYKPDLKIMDLTTTVCRLPLGYNYWQLKLILNSTSIRLNHFADISISKCQFMATNISSILSISQVMRNQSKKLTNERLNYSPIPKFIILISISITSVKD